MSQDFWDNINNSDGTINLNHPVFQQGRNLYDCSILLATKKFEPEIVEKLLSEFSKLINIVGHLTYELSSLKDSHKQLKSKLIEIGNK